MADPLALGIILAVVAVILAVVLFVLYLHFLWGIRDRKIVLLSA